MAEPAVRRMTLDEFLQWDDGTDARYEFAGGEPVAMAPGSTRLGVLAQRAGSLIEEALGPDSPSIVAQGGGILAERDGDRRFYVADVVMTCEPSDDDPYVRSPRLVVEILAPSTQGLDKHQKVPDYGQIDSVEEIWLVQSRARWVIVWRREAGAWIGSLPVMRAGSFRSHLLGAEISLDRLYRGTGL